MCRLHRIGVLLLLFLLPGLAGAEKLPFATPRDPHALEEFALIETTKGPFEIRFLRDEAPMTVANFQHLAKKNFYNNTVFHRFRPGYVLEGGDPLGTGLGGPGYTLPPEMSNVKHIAGTIGMTRKQNEINPERRSNGSVFYITLRRAPNLDGMYTAFAQVIEGLEVVNQLTQQDKILKVSFPRRQH